MNINHRYFIFIIFLLSINTIGIFATDVYLPAMPMISKELMAYDSTVQLTLTLYFLSFSISPIFFGSLSDVIGRKKVLVIGLLISIFATVICIYPASIYSLLIGRFIQGIGMGAVAAAGRAVIPDLFQGADLAKLMSVVTMAVPLFLSLAPVIGGYIAYYYSWQAIFILLIIYLIINFLYFSLIFKNSNLNLQQHSLANAFTAYWSLCKNPLFMIYGCYPAFTVIGINAYITASPFLFQDLLGMSMLNYGKISILIGVLIIIGGALNTKLLDKFSAVQILNSSWIIVLISASSMLIMQLFNIHTTLSLLIPCMIFFASIPFMAANANALCYAYIKSDYGAAGSLVTFVQMFAGFLTAGIMSFLPKDTYYPLACAILFCALVGKFLLIIADQIDNKNKTS